MAHQGKQICFNANSTTSGGSGPDKLTIVDVTNKSAPVKLSSPTYPGSGFIHQGWLTEDHRYFLVDDELDEDNFGHNTKTYMWDLLDLDAPVLMGFHLGPTTAIDHNQYIQGNYSYQANYTAGLRILDLTNLPSRVAHRSGALRRRARRTTTPGFNGAWGVFPFFASGTVIVSGISGTSTGGLFILRPTLGADFSLQATPSTLGVCGTGSANTTVNVTPANGYTGTVTFGSTGLPVGATFGFVPTSTAVPGVHDAHGHRERRRGRHVSLHDHRDRRHAHAADERDAQRVHHHAARADRSRRRPTARPTSRCGPASPGWRRRAPPATTSRSPRPRCSCRETSSSRPPESRRPPGPPPTDLASNTTYYWRVRTTTACGSGPYSAPRSFTTIAPAAGCPLGTTAQTAFNESFETGALSWNHNGIGDTWASSTLRVHDGAFSFRAIASPTVSDQRMTSPPILLPPASQAPVTLQFWNWQEIQNEITDAPEHVGCRDGAILEISTDGSNWTRLETQLLTDPYDGLVSAGTGNPLAGVGRLVRQPAGLAQLGGRRHGLGRPERALPLPPGHGQLGRARGLVPGRAQGAGLRRSTRRPSLSIDDVTAEEADAHDAPDHSPLLTFAVNLSAPSGADGHGELGHRQRHGHRGARLHGRLGHAHVRAGRRPRSPSTSRCCTTRSRSRRRRSSST